MTLKCCFCPQDAIACERLLGSKFHMTHVLLPVCREHKRERIIVCNPGWAEWAHEVNNETPVLQLVSPLLWLRFVKWIENNAREQSPTFILPARGPEEVFGYTGSFNEQGEFISDGHPPKATPKEPAVVDLIRPLDGRKVMFRNASGRKIEAGEAVRVTYKTEAVPSGMVEARMVDSSGQIRCWGDGCGVMVTPKADHLAYCPSCYITSCPKCDFAYGEHMLGVSPLFQPICPKPKPPKMADRPERCSVHGCYQDAEPGHEICRTHATLIPNWPAEFQPKNATGGRKCSWATCQEDAMPGQPACVNHLPGVLQQDVPDRRHRCGSHGCNNDAVPAGEFCKTHYDSGWSEFGLNPTTIVHGIFTADTTYPPEAAKLAEQAREAPPLNELLADLKAQRTAYLTREPQFAPGPECKRPPAGYRCTRGEGHDGPCAAWPVISAADAEVIVGGELLHAVEDSHGGTVKPGTEPHHELCFCAECLPYPDESSGVPGE